MSALAEASRAGGITSQRQTYASMLDAVRLLEVNARISFKVTAERRAGDARPLALALVLP